MAPSAAQYNHLLNSIAHDKELLYGNFEAPLGVVRVPRRWNEIALELNALDGVKKSGEKWKKTWIDLRGRAREAARKQRVYLHGTGGGPPASVAGLGLSPLYERVINLTGLTAVWGTGCPNPLQIQLNLAQAQGGQAPEGAAVAIDALAPIAPAAVIAPVGQAAPILDDDAAIAPFGQEAVGQAADEAIIAQVGQAADEAIIAQVGQAAENINPSQIIKGNIFANDDLEWEPFQFGNEIIIVEDLPSDQEIYGEVQGAAAPLVKHEFKYQVPKDEEVEVITLSDTPIKQSLSHTPPRGSGLTPANKRRMSTAAIPRHNTAAVSSTSVKVEKDFEMLTDNPHWPVPQRSKKLLYSEREQVAAVGHPSIKEQLRAIVLGNTMLMRGLIGVVSAMKIE